MNRTSTKATAEAVLRELPSVMGAYVSEDLEGHPREVHILLRAGPDPATLARDIRGLLQDRLGIPIDQRVISIAQLAADPGAEGGEEELPPASALAEPAGLAPVEARPLFAGLDSTVSSGQVRVGVRLQWQGSTASGTADAADTLPGRARAAASATLRAAGQTAEERVAFELDFASVVQALDGEYVLVSVLGLSGHVGRRPLPLVGAHPVESDVETAATFATLKAINRVLALALRDG
jgi:hypothetical protein